MDMIKIGKFIAEKRKENNLTQLELAEKLNMTDRAISKWECGKSMPDSSIMLELCSILGISVNELLTGEEIKMEEYKERAELNLTELKRQKEESDKRLLNAEVFLGLYTSLLFFALIFTASFVEMADWLRIVLIATGLVFFAIGVHICLKIEQKAGYYECAKCHHTFVPTYKQTTLSMHMGRTRYMKCPHCNEKSWCKKVISGKEE